MDAVDDVPTRKQRVYLRDTLMNEYRDNPELIGGAFADLLPLGFTKADMGGKGGTLPKKMVRAWFLSRDRRFAEHKAFNHFMFNQKLRHDTNVKVSVKVRGNDAKTQELTQLVNEEDFEARLLTAIKNPTSMEAKEISKKVLPLLKIVGSRVGWSSLERSNTLTRLYAMNQFFGTSFLFVTLSPSMRNTPLAIRMCSPDGQETTLPPLHMRTKMIADNPIVTARVFDRMMRAFFEIICGFPLDHFTGLATNVDRLLNINESEYVGAFGKLKAIYAIIEDQTGGSLHMHGHLWGQIDNRVLTRWIHDPSFRKKVTSFIDSIVTTEIPDEVVEEQKELGIKSVISAQPYPSAADLSRDSAHCRLRLNTHKHSFTCWKDGCEICRLTYPRPKAYETYIAHLIADPTKTDELIPVRKYPLTISGQETISEPPAFDDTLPIDPDEERVLATGLRRRTNIEQRQSESNPITTSLMRCNSSMQPTIAPTESRNAIYYSSKYCSKNPYRLSSTLSLLYTAQVELRKYGSLASDAGTPSRTTKCLLQKVLHKSGQIEIADQQAAAANLGNDSFFTSHKFGYVFIWDAVKKHQHYVDSREDDTAADEDTVADETASILEVDSNGKFFTLRQLDMYLWKSGVFSDMSYYDYACCVRPIRSSPNDELENRDNRKGRQKLERYPFEGFGCPIPDSMAQVLTCIPTVPILAGAPPPSSPGRRPPLDADEDEQILWEKKARVFVQYYALLFLPFGPDMDPRDPTMPHLRVLPWDSAHSNF